MSGHQKKFRRHKLFCCVPHAVESFQLDFSVSLSHNLLLDINLAKYWPTFVVANDLKHDSWLPRVTCHFEISSSYFTAERFKKTIPDAQLFFVYNIICDNMTTTTSAKLSPHLSDIDDQNNVTILMPF